MYTAGGEAVYWSVSGAPLRAADGRIIGAVAIHRDITEQKRLECELRQRRDGVQTYSITGKAQWRNVSGARLRSEGGTITRADLVSPTAGGVPCWRTRGYCTTNAGQRATTAG